MSSAASPRRQSWSSPPLFLTGINPGWGRAQASVASAVGAAGNQLACWEAKGQERGIIRQQKVLEKSSGPPDEAEEEDDDDESTCLEQVC